MTDKIVPDEPVEFSGGKIEPDHLEKKPSYDAIEKENKRLRKKADDLEEEKKDLEQKIDDLKGDMGMSFILRPRRSFWDWKAYLIGMSAVLLFDIGMYSCQLIPTKTQREIDAGMYDFHGKIGDAEVYSGHVKSRLRERSVLELTVVNGNDVFQYYDMDSNLDADHMFADGKEILKKDKSGTFAAHQSDFHQYLAEIKMLNTPVPPQ